ncbi:MAG: hypothetical protein RIK87_23465 [Fuerstiella sp.]
MKLFRLGDVYATPRALEALEQADVPPSDLLRRHREGDWGDLSQADNDANTSALENGSRIFSAYVLANGIKVWVITEAVNDTGDRESTCLLLPSEY